MTDKIALRRLMRARRRAYADGLAAAERTELLAALADRLLHRLPSPRIVGCYAAMGGEIDPEGVARAFQARGSLVAYPRVDTTDSALVFHRVDDVAALQGGFRRIPEPPASAPVVTPDLLLVPLVAADEQGNRLGQGAGLYDRTLVALKEHRRLTAIGLAWDMQIVSHLPVDPWDVPLDAIVTPTRWIAAHR